MFSTKQRRALLQILVSDVASDQEGLMAIGEMHPEDFTVAADLRKNLPAIDGFITASCNRSIARIFTIDLAILRIATQELLVHSEPKIVFATSQSLAENFGADPRFILGVLNGINQKIALMTAPT